MNLTDNEIKKALECCTKGNTSDVCVDCPLRTTDICTEEENGVLKLALDYINRLEAENGRLQAENKGLTKEKEKAWELFKKKCNEDIELQSLCDKHRLEIERLQGEIGKLNKAYPCTIQMSDYCLMYARSLDDYDKLIGDISVEAIKKFKQTVKTLFRLTFLRRKRYDKIFDEAEAMLLKEMVGEGG